MALTVLMEHKDNPHTGKGFFLNRLHEAFRHIGVSVVTDPRKSHDIYLAFNSFKFITKKPKILRLNGCYHNTRMKGMLSANAEIRSQVKRADGVVYQSEFCRKMHEKYIGLHDNHTVIFNGAPIMKPEKTMPYVLVAARMRPHKRLDEARVAAEIAQVPIVICAGKIPRDEVDDYMRKASALVHLSWIDWNPNSVVEALASGCPVITNNVGGTQELIKDGCGKILDVDAPYNMKPVDLYHPPKIDLNIVAQAIRESLDWPRVTNNSHVDIINVARQYADFINSCLGAR